MPTPIHPPATAAQVWGRRSMPAGNQLSVAASTAYHPATHQSGGPATHVWPAGTRAAQYTTVAMPWSMPSQAAPQPAASVVETLAASRQRKPQAIANATSGATSTLTSRPTELTTWNFAATRGVVAAQTAAPVTNATQTCQAHRRRNRSVGERLRSIRRSMGSSGCRLPGRAAAIPTSTPVERNESCAPALNTSAGRHASTTIAATARALIAGDLLPTAAARQESQTSSVARSTGVSAWTSSI